MPDNRVGSVAPGLQRLQGIQFAWLDHTAMPLQFADHASIQRLQGRCYLTFGQSILPLVPGASGEPVKGSIAPVVRLACTENDLRNMVAAILRVLDAPDPKEPAE